MNQLQFSTKQLFTILAGTAVATVTVFSLGLFSATLIADRPQEGTADLAEAQPPVAAIARQDAPKAAAADAAIIPIQAQTPRTAARYGVQVAVFAQRENAIHFVARHANPTFPARVFRRAEDGDRRVYPVLVGLYDSMDEARQAQQAYHTQSSADAFVTDASGLQEETLPVPALAMLH